MKGRLNILFLSSWYPSRVHRTNGNFIKRHAKAISLKNNILSLYVQSDENINQIEVVNNKISDHFSEFFIFYPKVKDRLSIFNIIKKLYWNIRCYKKALLLIPGVDIIHGNVLFPVILWAYWLSF